MGGIAGIFHPATPKPVDPARIASMIAAQAHRGPDGQGVWTAPGVGLGHRRLAVIDPKGSPQPMQSGALAVTCDGAIHNFAELRAALELKGARFLTAGDAEVLLHGWRAWGPAMLDRLDGTFAFALHDADTGTLFLARDRIGVKPLHYVELSDGSVAFSSELKGLLAHPLLRRVPDVTAVEDFLAYGYVPDDACIVAGVRKLPAGHCLTVQRWQGMPRPRQWWDVSFADRAAGSTRALGEDLLARMREAVRSGMVADVPLGALLSGGVDSAAVVALMAEASKAAVRTCTIGFDGAGQDERPHAAAVAARFATDHHAQAAKPDDFALIDTLVHHFDEPFADGGALAAYQLAALARQSVTVALAGDGADEILAGHRRYGSHATAERVRGWMPDTWRSAFAEPGRLPAGAALTAIGLDGGEAYARMVGVTSPEWRARLLSPQARAALGGHRAEDRYVAAMRMAPARDAIDRAQYADLKIRVPGDILTKVDRTSMAVGLEAREPLLDHRLVAFCATLPTRLRLRRGQGKWLMKRSLERYLPKDILSRPRMGFAAPVGAWFRGPLAAEAEALARSRMLIESGWFDMAVVARLAEDHRSGKADHGRTLWQLLMLERSVRRLFG